MIYFLQLKAFGLKIKIKRIDLKRLSQSVAVGKGCSTGAIRVRDRVLIYEKIMAPLYIIPIKTPNKIIRKD